MTFLVTLEDKGPFDLQVVLKLHSAFSELLFQFRRVCLILCYLYNESFIFMYYIDNIFTLLELKCSEILDASVKTYFCLRDVGSVRFVVCYVVRSTVQWQSRLHCRQTGSGQSQQLTVYFLQ